MKKFFIKNKISLMLLAILAISIIERFYKLETTPSWYTDEGSNVEMIWNLLHGQLRLQGLEQTFIPHFPFFYIAGGLFILVFGKTILSLRIMASVCTVATTLILYLIGKEIRSKFTGLLAALIFCLSTEYVLLARYGLSAYLATLEIVLIIFFIIKYIRTNQDKWLFASAFVAALTMITEIYLWGIIIVYPILLYKEKKKLLKVLAVSLSLFGLFLAVMLLIRGDWFIKDIQYYFMMRPFTPANTDNFQYSSPNLIARIIINFTKWTQSIIYYFGFAGLLFIPGRKNRLTIIACLLMLILPLYSYGQVNFISRNIVYIIPFLSLGSAFFILSGHDYVRKSFFQKNKYKLILISIPYFLFFIVIFGSRLKILHDFVYDYNKLYVTNDSYRKMDPRKIKLVAEYLNERVNKKDYVIAPNYLSFLINATTGDVFSSASYEGIDTEIISPEYFDRKRFVFNHAPEMASYFVDDLVEKEVWLTDHPALKNIYNRVEKWPVVYKVDNFEVRENPDIKKI